MSTLTGRRFSKMNGCGNEIIVLDLRDGQASVSPAEARAIASAPGLSFDQLMVIEPPHHAGSAGFLRILNRDGSESGACGNGTRCVAHQLMQNSASSVLILESRAGALDCRREAKDLFTVDMGPPRLSAADIPLSLPFPDTRRIEIDTSMTGDAELVGPACVSMGNPHAIFFVADVVGHDLEKAGPLLEHHAVFPERANITLAQVESRSRIVARTWERGVGLTRACGSAACAVLVAAVRRGLTERRAEIVVPGGLLAIEWRAGDDHVLMTGPVEVEFEGCFEDSVFAGIAA